MPASRAFVFGAAAIAIGCGGGKTTIDGAVAHDGAPGDSKPTDAATGSCVAPGYGSAATAMSITSADATIVDLSNTALAGVITYVRGTDLSSAPAMTAANGHATVSGSLSYKLPMFTYGDSIAEPLLGIPLTAATTSLGTLQTALFPAAGQPMVAGGSVTSGTATLTLADGASIAIDTLVYGTTAQQQFRAVTLPIAAETAFLAHAPSETELVVATSPADTLICPPAAMTVTNSAGWPANTDVEFYVFGTDAAQDWAPYGGWGKLSDGKVSADGATISTGGIAVLGVIGVRLKP